MYRLLMFGTMLFRGAQSHRKGGYTRRRFVTLMSELVICLKIWLAPTKMQGYKIPKCHKNL